MMASSTSASNYLFSTRLGCCGVKFLEIEAIAHFLFNVRIIPVCQIFRSSICRPLSLRCPISVCQESAFTAPIKVYLLTKHQAQRLPDILTNGVAEMDSYDWRPAATLMIYLKPHQPHRLHRQRVYRQVPAMTTLYTLRALKMIFMKVCTLFQLALCDYICGHFAGLIYTLALPKLTHISRSISTDHKGCIVYTPCGLG